MTGDDTVQLNRLVGGLEAKIDAFQNNWVEQDRRAAEGRKFLYEKVEGFGRDFFNLSHQVATVVHDVAEMKPAVQGWVNTQNQAIGARTAMTLFGRCIYGVLGAGVMGAAWAIVHFSPTVLH